MPSRTNSGATRSAGAHRRLGEHVADRRRGPQPTQSSGRKHRGHRTSRTADNRWDETGRNRPVMSHRSPRARRRWRQRRRRPRVTPKRPRSRARRRRRLARCSDRSRRAGRPIRSAASARAADPLPSTTTSAARSVATSAPEGARATVEYASTAVTSWPRARKPSTSDDEARSPWATSTADEPGWNAASRPSTRWSSGTRSAGRPASCSRVEAVAAPTAASRTRDAVGRRLPDGTGTVDRRDDKPVEPLQHGQRLAQPDAPIGRRTRLGQRHVVDHGAVIAQPIGELARPLLGQDDAATVEWAVHHAPTASRRGQRAQQRPRPIRRCSSPTSMRSRNTVPPVAGQERIERCPVTVRPDGQRAAGAELVQEGALDDHRVARRRVIDRRERRRRGGVAVAALDGDTALADGRHEPGGFQALGDPVRQTEHLQCCDRHHDRAAVRDLFEAPSDVAAQLDEREIGSLGGQLRSPAHRTGRDRRARRGPPSVAPISASAGSRRSQNAPITRPAGVSLGRSLAEWTATSARPSSTACWISLTNTPCPPIVCSATD